MERRIRQILLLLLIAIPFLGHAQVLIYAEDFETNGEGTRYNSNTYSFCSGTPGNNPDYFLRTNSNPVLPTGCSAGFGSTLTGLQGSFFWAGEDICSSAPTPNAQPPGQLTTQNIGVAGYNTLTVSVYLATSNNNSIRWETADSINVQASLNGGPFRTVGRFMGDNVVGGHLRIDSNLDGAITGADPAGFCDTILFTKYTFNIAGTGTNLQIRMDFDQLGGTEESAFDQIEVNGIFAGGPEINVQGNAITIPDGDTSPDVNDGTDFGSQAACLGAVPHTFTIQNTGTQTLNITGTIIAGGNFSDFAILTQPSSTVSAAGIATFTIIFNPTGNGVRTTTLNILNDDPDEGNYDFQLLGIGLPDTTPPVVTCPGDTTLVNDPGQCIAILNYTVTETDNCGQPTQVQTAGNASGSAFPFGTTTNSFQSQDGDGNMGTCSFNVTVVDNEDPIALCQGDTLYLSPADSATLLAADINDGSIDNCVIDSISVSPSAFNANNLGVNTVTLTVFDGSGNTSTCQGFVLVLDTNQVAITPALNDDLGMTISPNPTLEFMRVQVECPTCLPGDQIELEVAALDGRVVKRIVTVANGRNLDVMLDLSQVARGSYLLRLSHDGEVLRRQVIRQ